jgi:MYXO-CTERM domain-containing protein
MFPEGGNLPTAFRDDCDAIVGSPELDPGDPSCPEVNLDYCSAGDLQNPTPLLATLFGPGYVDAIAPTVELAEPSDGQYFQVPGNFAVVLDIEDDLHPQLYSMWAWIGDEPRPAEPSELVEPGFEVVDLPVGTWEFHLAIADEAGNETRLDFTVEVGTHPVPVDDGCACAADGAVRPPALAGFTVVALVLGARRRRVCCAR